MVLTEPVRVDRPDASVRGPAWGAVDLDGLDPARERPYWLALAAVPGIGPVSFARLLGRFRTAEAAWRRGVGIADHIERASDETASVLRQMHAEGVIERARRVERGLAAIGARAVTALDDDYPPRLREADPRPPVLYVRGDLRALDGLCVAVVGTRRPSGYGRAVAAEIADEIARADGCVVSGLAVGIDAEAHAAALDATGPTVAVLPSPLDRVYPPRNRALAERIVASGGLLVSELPPERPLGRPDFARRNRVMAAASQATVVVEAPNGSGALLTAAAAIDYGRDVYAVPGPIDARASEGCNRLIADHAAELVTSAVGLLHQLGARSGTSSPAVASLSEAEGIVLAAVLRRSGSIEELIARTKLATSSLASALTLLEARGLISSYGGATFHASLAARRLDAEGRAR